MKPLALSIRKKIIYSFALVLLLVSCTALMTYAIVKQVERKVALVEVIDDFLNTTLELRRYEKNYFLYGQQKDFEDVLFYWQRLSELLDANRAELLNLVSGARLRGIHQITLAYKEDMEQFHGLRLKGGATRGGRSSARIQEEVRRNGKLLTEFAEQTALAERVAIRGLLVTTRSILIISALVMATIFSVMATVLGRRLVASLRMLEGYTKKIAHGEMLDPPHQAVEEEINTLFLAFQRMNRELQNRQRQLVQSEKLAALGTLLAGVAHELNNPLSNISTSAQILTEEIEAADLVFKKNLLAQIDAQTDKARDIVRSLLEFSRTKEFKKETVPLKKLLEDTIRLIRGQVASAVSIKLELSDEIIIYVDKQRMQQAFLNLLKNALDALGESGNIWVSAQRIEAETGPVVEIIFADDGPGIPEEIQERIFDPFFTTKDVGQGSGLGLFVVHDIIEAHGGDLLVDSRPGNGTTFVIWLREDSEVRDNG